MWLVAVPLTFLAAYVLKPVSYTHLDVYKRQVNRTAWEGRSESVRTT